MKKIIPLVLAAVSFPALTAENAIDRLVNCVEIRDSRDRLACFDREVVPLASARPKPVVPGTSRPQLAQTPVPVDPAPIAPVPSARSFGEEQLPAKPRSTEPVDDQALHARIERLRTITTGDYMIYLDNGQIWRHQDSVLGEYLREGDAITISRGTLGSYRLTRDAGKSKNWIRVTRFR